MKNRAPQLGSGDSILHRQPISSSSRCVPLGSFWGSFLTRSRLAAIAAGIGLDATALALAIGFTELTATKAIAVGFAR